MKNILKIFTAIFTLTLFNNLSAQTADEQKAWMEYMTPGSVHEMIAKSDGEWTEEVTMWMDATSEPMKMNSTCTNKMILGGRYQYSTHNGTMMGMPFEGISILAYDNAKKIFQNIWIDNMGTGIMNLSGPWDESTKSVTLTGTSVDPSTGKDVQIREVFKITGDNTQTVEMYLNKDGKEFKNMSINLTRK